MFKSYEMMQTDIKHNVQGGEGSPKFRHLFSAEELGNRGELLAVITLEPGESVGVHPHTSNGEAYFILEGGATMTEDDETRILGVGDAEFCAAGQQSLRRRDRILRIVQHDHRHNSRSCKSFRNIHFVDSLLSFAMIPINIPCVFCKDHLSFLLRAVGQKEFSVRHQLLIVCRPQQPWNICPP